MKRVHRTSHAAISLGWLRTATIFRQPSILRNLICPLATRLKRRTRAASASLEGGAMLNRGVVIVRPKQPYLDWAAGLDDSGIVPDPNGEQTVYLIPSYADD